MPWKSECSWGLLIRYQSAVAAGDYSSAISSLRRFYDHKSPSTRSQHAHGLLNLAAFLYQTGGIDSARTVSMAIAELTRPWKRQSE